MGKYTLIITEKPDAAQRIAHALDAKGKAKKIEENGVPYYVAKRDKDIVVVPALGHLYTVMEERTGRHYYPVFSFKWAPRHLAERGAKKIRTWIETISKLAKDAEDFVDACDYDIEGSLIGYCILKYACDNKESVAKRMKYSTLTKPELETAYEKPLSTLDFALIEAGRTRHEVDWLYGVNLSRALTLAAKRWSGKYATLRPIPFDLGALQAEAYGLFGYTPRRTSGIAERLYLEALISYPRTSSQKLPPAINYRKILQGLSKVPKYKKLTAELLGKPELVPKEGKKEDPAHPAIYPTGNLPERELDESEKRIWDLVVRRFMAVFAEPAVKQSMKVTINVNGHRFFVRGRQTLKEGWQKFYAPYIRSEEVMLPPIKEGDRLKIKKVILEDKFTKPPPRYNPGSLLKKMEEEGIGTKATRADIIQTLYNRKYIKDERIIVTGLGFDVVELLEKYCPPVVSVELTRELEEKMEQIQLGKQKREAIIVEAVELLKPTLERLKEKEETIGEVLSKAIKKARIEERMVGDCPNCGTGKLMILYSRRTGKRFIGCTNYFKGKCTTSFPLPQRGTLKPLGKPCRACGWPTIQVRMKGRRPWTLCFNPECPLIEERKKRLEMQSMRKGNGGK